jgi:hypothetical protein
MSVKKASKKDIELIVEDELLHDAEYGTSVNEDIEDSNHSGVNKLTELINAINNTLHAKNKERKGSVTTRQYLAISRLKAFNEYMYDNYNYRYKILDALCDNVIDYSLSNKALGFLTSAESLKGLNTSVELNELRGSALERLRR